MSTGTKYALENEIAVMERPHITAARIRMTCLDAKIAEGASARHRLGGSRRC